VRFRSYIFFISVLVCVVSEDIFIVVIIYCWCFCKYIL